MSSFGIWALIVARQEVTGADRQWAEQYRPGDVVRYTKGSRIHSLAAGEYVRVALVDAEQNLVTVRRKYGARVTYDPRRLQGVTLYRESDRAFAKGDRVQVTAPHREQQIANRELGTIEASRQAGAAPPARFGPHNPAHCQGPCPPRLRLCGD